MRITFRFIVLNCFVVLLFCFPFILNAMNSIRIRIMSFEFNFALFVVTFVLTFNFSFSTSFWGQNEKKLFIKQSNGNERTSSKMVKCVWCGTRLQYQQWWSETKKQWTISRKSMRQWSNPQRPNWIFHSFAFTRVTFIRNINAISSWSNGRHLNWFWKHEINLLVDHLTG